jgi:hypothetical protein
VSVEGALAVGFALPDADRERLGLGGRGGDRRPSGRSALVAMVQAAHFGKRDNPTDIRTINRSWLWGVLVQAEMRSAPVIVIHEVTQVVTEAAFTAADDHVVQAFTTDRADEAFDVGALPERPRRR